MKKLYSLIGFCFLAGQFLSGQTSSYSYTGAEQIYTVPADVFKIQIETWGAQGAAGLSTLGGLGGYSKGELSVTPGQTLYVYVGGTGSGTLAGWNGGGVGGTDLSMQNGGGGGGASDVRSGGNSLADRIIVAGGGAGGGRDGSTGAGGGASGTASSDYPPGYAGQPGTQVSGGIAYITTRGATNGTLGLGGNGSTGYDAAGGGGGGGGYYGGGGGTSTVNHGSGYSSGGGGGSAYIGGVSNAITSSGVRSGFGGVTITVLTIPPTVNTTVVSSIGITTATSGGNVTNDNGYACTEKGVCWSTTNPPVIGDSKTTDGSGTGAFTSSVTGLSPGTVYYLRAYATSSIGTGYGGLETFTPLKNDQMVSFNALAAKTYGDATFNLTATASSGLPVSYTSSNLLVATISGNTVTIIGQGSSVITASQAGNASYNPAPDVPQTLTVNKKGLTVSGALASNKVYDGTLTTAITGGSLVGIVVPDVVTLATATSGTFDTPTVGSEKTVTAAMTITGADAGNYSITQPALTANVTAKGLTVTGSTVANKVYDGTLTAAITGGSLVGIVVPDDVTLATATAGTFATATVGAGKTVTSAMTLTGAAAGNYSIIQPALTANITAKALTVTGATAANKVYDASTSATISGGTLNGVVVPDVVTLASATSGTFASATAGTGKTVTSSMTLTGAAAGNYSITQPTLTANITAKALIVTGASATNKVYDGNLTAVLTGGSLVGVVGADVVTLATNTSGTFASATVGTGKTVTSSMTLTGAAAGNYSITQPALTANITAKALTVTGASATNKVYDGTLTAVLTGGSLVGVIAPDVVTLATSTSGTFDTPIVGTGKSVTSAMTITGAAAGNYTITQPTLAADITAKELTVTGAVAADKVYDGTADAVISGAILDGVVGLDEVTLVTETVGLFVSANVGTAIVVTPAMTITGAAAVNYTLTQPTLTADITAKELTVSGAVVANKVYNGNTDAVISGAILNGLVNLDDVTLENATAGIFASAASGTNISVATAMTLLGAASGNYTLVQPILSADIIGIVLTVSDAVAANKVYDGTTVAVISGGTLNGIIGSEDVTLATATTGTFTSANVGAGISVISDMTLAGADAGKYTLEQPGLTADITAKGLTVTAEDKSKTYGDVNPELTVIYTGFAGDEDDTFITTVPSAITTALQYSDVGTYDIVPEGGEADNYAFVYINGTLTVNKAQLEISAMDTNRAEGDLNPVFMLTYSGFKGSDDTASIDELPTASSIANTLSTAGDYDIVLTGGSDGNYSLVLHNGTLTVTPVTTILEGKSVKISVYPNPAVDYLYLKNLPEKTVVRIFNLQGSIVKNSISSIGTEKIDVIDLLPGIYIIRLSGNEIDTVMRFAKE